MKGFASASLKFSCVPGKFLGCACFHSEGSPVGRWVESGGLCRFLHAGGSGEHCRLRPQWSVLLHISFGTSLFTLGCEMHEETPPNEARRTGNGEKKAALAHAMCWSLL